MTITALTTAAAALIAGTFALGLIAPKQLKTEVVIDAPPSAVWQTLMQTQDYADWNPFICDLSGELAVGNKISATIRLPESNPMTFSPTILASDPQKELRWVGKLGVNGIFDGEHYFTLEPRADGTTLLKHGETFRGLLAYPLMALIGAKTKAGFDAMNSALKQRVEAKA
ncbi:SRPBCC domain-containing protein [Actibacterium pelagium]|uniref:SRPBCC domain-containing protein n=1 Tax=Actibacterium pelagium TaxID=2029103 RepID=A0A917EKL5_9RHOB|nr:SRPBCC domain-containing protein [Actibacterium pelagium]GGE57669.1 hypothetical protein GCM10011517_26800 [Actibacterium pelagium]